MEWSGARLDEPWVHGARAWLLSRRRSTGNSQDVEGSLRKGIDIARRQSSKMAELILTVALSRLCNARGRRQEAKEMLGEIYPWFTEGFDTTDLKEAKALLEELS